MFLEKEPLQSKHPSSPPPQTGVSGVTHNALSSGGERTTESGLTAVASWSFPRFAPSGRRRPHQGRDQAGTKRSPRGLQTCPRGQRQDAAAKEALTFLREAGGQDAARAQGPGSRSAWQASGPCVYLGGRGSVWPGLGWHAEQGWLRTAQCTSCHSLAPVLGPGVPPGFTQ